MNLAWIIRETLEFERLSWSQARGYENFKLPSLHFTFFGLSLFSNNNNPQHVEEKSRLWKITERDSCALEESFLEAIEN